MVIGKKIRNMVRENKDFKIKIFMKEIGKMIKFKDLECIGTIMVILIKAILIML